MTRMDDIGRQIGTLKGRVCTSPEETADMMTQALLAIAEVLMEINTTLTYIKMNTRGDRDRRRDDE